VAEFLSLSHLRREVSRLQTVLREHLGGARDPDRLQVEVELHHLELKAQHHELREAQGRLELSEARYSALYHGAPVAFCTLDRQGLIRELNDAAAALLGRSVLALEGRSLMPMVAEGSRNLFWDHLRRCTERRGQVCTELSLVPGLTREVRVQLLSSALPGPQPGFHTALLDVTSERQAQRRLQTLATAGRKLGEAQDERAALEAVCSAAIDTMVDACAAWLDEPEGGPVCAAAGPPPVVERLKKAMEARALPHALAALAREATSGAGSGAAMGLSPDVSAWLFDGEGAPATVAIAGLEARHGVRGWVVAAVRPPRQAFAAEDLLLMQQLAERLGQCLQAQRLYQKALGEVRVREDFLAIVSHDLVNAAASIKLTAQAMNGQAMATSQHGHVRRIRSSAEWIMSVVRKLLDVAALESGALPLDPMALPAGALLQEAHDALAPLAEESRIELRVSAPRDAWVRADEDRLLQVFSNLVVNAIKHAPEKSTVELGARRAGAEVQFFVQDHGPGISPEDLPHVFDRFWQARRAKRAGVGLGLSIVKAIVEAHGGRAWAESQAQGGATFWFVLPAIESPVTAAAQPAAERREERP